MVLKCRALCFSGAWYCVVELESIAEVLVLKVGEIKESLLDADALGLAATILSGDVEPSVFAELLLFFFSSSGGLCGITLQVASVQEPAEDQDDDDLDAV